MSKRKSKKRKTRSHDEGLWLITEEGIWIEVKKSLIKADKIVPAPAIRWGKPHVEGKPIELVENASYPVFREDHPTLVKQKFADMDFTAESLFPNDEIAETRYNNLINAILTVSKDIPLDTYEKYKVDRHLNKVEDAQKYQVVGINEDTGREILDVFPELLMTHQIRERALPLPEAPNALGPLKVLPRIYYDLWLTERLYELKAFNDAGRFEMTRLMNKLENYPFPVLKEDGTPELDGDGQPMVKHEEAMLYFDGYVAQTGSTKQYHAFIVSQRIQAEDGEKFVFEMKLSKTIKKYTKTMDIPVEGEIPITVSAQQRPLVISDVAEMLKAITV